MAQASDTLLIPVYAAIVSVIVLTAMFILESFPSIASVLPVKLPSLGSNMSPIPRIKSFQKFLHASRIVACLSLCALSVEAAVLHRSNGREDWWNDVAQAVLYVSLLSDYPTRSLWLDLIRHSQ